MMLVVMMANLTERKDLVGKIILLPLLRSRRWRVKCKIPDLSKDVKLFMTWKKGWGRGVRDRYKINVNDLWNDMQEEFSLLLCFLSLTKDTLPPIVSKLYHHPFVLLYANIWSISFVVVRRRVTYDIRWHKLTSSLFFQNEINKNAFAQFTDVLREMKICFLTVCEANFIFQIISPVHNP
jgi:hypothetical protein